MATRLLTRRLALSTSLALSTTLLILPHQPLHADSPPPSSLQQSRKPIYSDPPTPLRKHTYPLTSTQQTRSDAPTSTPTTITTNILSPSLLSPYIRTARLFLHAHLALAEDSLNSTLTTLFHHEAALTSTLASLRPPPESNEKLLSGSIYVLIATMAGSILSRNRNILLRATVPGLVGLGAAWVVLPVTMGNVGALVWRWEERVPVVRENHLRVRRAVVGTEEVVRERVEGAGLWIEGAVKGGRIWVEGVVKGKGQ